MRIRVQLSRFEKFVLLSILLHIIILVLSTLLSRLSLQHSEQAKREDVDIEVVRLSKKEFQRLKNQIAESKQVQKAKEAAKDAYLGAQTQVVQKQTRARNTGSFQDQILSRAPRRSPKNNERSHPKLKLSNLGVAMNLKPLGNLSPEKRKLGQSAATNDYLKDIEHGAQTLLNTKEFAYFTFYQRVRKQLEQFWEPGLRAKIQKMYDRGRNLATNKEHATKLLVVLNSKGTITRILVQDTSGINDLDQAAIEAFNRAGPFPNPPKGMLEQDGTVKVAWEFVLRT